MIIPRLITFMLLLFASLFVWAPAQPPAGAAASANFSLFPVWGSDKGEFIGLSLTNTGNAANQVAVTWTNADGNVTRTGFLSLDPGCQRVALISEILGLPEDPQSGWIRIDASAAGLISYMTSGRDGVLDGTEPASAVSTSMLLPHVAVNTGFMELAHTDTLISLVNPGSVAAYAHAELIGLNGIAAGNLTVPIPARASRTLLVSEAFHDVLAPNSVGGHAFRGYLRVDSDGGLAGWLRIDTPLSRRLLRGRGMEEVVSARLWMASHFAFGSPSLYHSELNCINAGNAPATLELVMQGNTGLRVSAVRTLKPRQAFREDVMSLFPIAIPAIYPPPMIDGYIRIRSADGGMVQIVGDMGITCGNAAASMMYPIAVPSPSDSILPFVISDAEYFTGYALANPNELLTVQTDVTITLLGGDGRLIGAPRILSLSPAARFVSLVEEKVRSGYLRIHANGPFALIGSIGTRSCSVLAQLPGQQ